MADEYRGLEGAFSRSFVVRGGKVVEWNMYDSNADARRAVGLGE